MHFFIKILNDILEKKKDVNAGKQILDRAWEESVTSHHITTLFGSFLVRLLGFTFPKLNLFCFLFSSLIPPSPTSILLSGSFVFFFPYGL